MMELATRLRDYLFPLAYLTIGIVCVLSVAMARRESRTPLAIDLALTFALWPLYAPIALMRPTSRPEAEAPTDPDTTIPALLARAEHRRARLTLRLESLEAMRASGTPPASPAEKRGHELIANEATRVRRELETLSVLMQELASHQRLRAITSILQSERDKEADLARELAVQLETCQELLGLSDGLGHSSAASSLNTPGDLGKVPSWPES